MEMHEPYTFLNGLTVADMEDLLEDIQVPPLPASAAVPASAYPCCPTPMSPCSSSDAPPSRPHPIGVHGAGAG